MQRRSPSLALANMGMGSMMAVAALASNPRLMKSMIARNEQRRAEEAQALAEKLAMGADNPDLSDFDRRQMLVAQSKRERKAAQMRARKGIQ